MPVVTVKLPISAGVKPKTRPPDHPAVMFIHPMTRTPGGRNEPGREHDCLGSNRHVTGGCFIGSSHVSLRGCGCRCRRCWFASGSNRASAPEARRVRRHQRLSFPLGGTSYLGHKSGCAVRKITPPRSDIGMGRKFRGRAAHRGQWRERPARGSVRAKPADCFARSVPSSRRFPTGRKISGAVTKCIACPACGCFPTITVTRSTIAGSSRGSKSPHDGGCWSRLHSASRMTARRIRC